MQPPDRHGLPISILLVDDGHSRHDDYVAGVLARGWRLERCLSTGDVARRIEALSPSVVIVVSGTLPTPDHTRLTSELSAVAADRRRPVMIVTEDPRAFETSARARTRDVEIILVAVGRALRIAEVLAESPREGKPGTGRSPEPRWRTLH